MRRGAFGLASALSLAAIWAAAGNPARAGQELPDAATACRLPAGIVWHHQPVLTLAGQANYGSDRSAEEFALTVMQGAAAWRGTADPAVAARLVAELVLWAHAHALETVVEVGPDLSNTNSVYSLRRVLIPLLAAWRDLRPAASPQDTRKIEGWLERLVRLADTDTGYRRSRGAAEAVSNRNNHSYMRATIDALLAGRDRADPHSAKAVATVRAAVATMRPDGSLPLETARGERALWYQRHALASLVFIAELLQPLGYDLYAPRSDGRSLHDAVEFLARAIAAPDLVAPYAAANRNPKLGTSPDRQDLGFLEPRGHGRHYMAWLELYRARFPDRPGGRDLARLIPPSLDAARPMIDELSGGNTSCQVAASARMVAGQTLPIQH